MKVVDTYNVNPHSKIYRVEVDENKFVDVFHNEHTGLIYVMNNHDGTLVYDNEGKTFDINVDEEEIFKSIKEDKEMSING